MTPLFLLTLLFQDFDLDCAIKTCIKIGQPLKRILNMFTQEESVMKPIVVEVLSLMLTVQTEECKNCSPIFGSVGLKGKFHNKEINEYPEDMKEQVLRLSNWIRDLSQRYPDQIQIKIIDALSILGIYKKLRHRIKELPAFIVDNRETYSGWDKGALDGILVRRLQVASA